MKVLKIIEWDSRKGNLQLKDNEYFVDFVSTADAPIYKVLIEVWAK